MIQGEADGSSGLSLHSTQSQDRGWLVYGLFALWQWDQECFGEKRGHTEPGRAERVAVPRWRSCILPSICWAEPAAVREAGCEENASPPHFWGFLAPGPENPGQHFQAAARDARQSQQPQHLSNPSNRLGSTQGSLAAGLF